VNLYFPLAATVRIVSEDIGRAKAKPSRDHDRTTAVILALERLSTSLVYPGQISLGSAWHLFGGIVIS
jgi:hypothetical protein